MTNKEHLESISDTVNKIAVSHYDLVATVSTFINEQSDYNTAQDKRYTSIKKYLHNDNDTGQDGAIQTIAKHDKRIDKLEIQNKITAGKILTATAIFTFIGGVFWSILGFFNK